MTLSRTHFSLAIILIAGAACFIEGIGWGLPSRQSDRFLFGTHQPWDGRKIILLAGEIADKSDRAADVSSNPYERQSHEVIANASDQDRARIVRRYRLMSYQPDEFTTFAALSRMKPAQWDLDPRMYKYGGPWAYPVGGLLKFASVVGWVPLTPDPAFYLDHPEAFGRFYVVARLYSAAWGLLGIVAVFLLVRMICGSIAAATCASACFILMPVVMTAAHEAKPHLAGTTLTLWAVLAAAKYVEQGHRRMAIVAAMLCGAAIAMVPSTLPTLILLPMMVLFRSRFHVAPVGPGTVNRMRNLRNVIGLLATPVLVYGVTNPYVLINLICNRAVLRSNFGNSSEFYHAGFSGLPRALMLAGLGTSFVLALAGGVGAIALAVRAARKPPIEPAEIRRRASGLLLAAVTIPVGVVFVVFAAGQPADYARFALPFDVFLAVEAVVAVQTFVVPRALRYMCFGALTLTAGFMGLQYLVGFERDCGPRTSRMIEAGHLTDLLNGRDAVLASREEPAPWSLPPVNLFRLQIFLPPRTWPEDRAFEGAAVTIGPADRSRHPSLGQLFFSTPISWADKPFAVQNFSVKAVAR